MPSSWADRFGVLPAPARELEAALAAFTEAETAVSPDGDASALLLERLFERARDTAVPLDWMAAPQATVGLVRLAYAAPFLVRHLAAFPGRLGRGVLTDLARGTALAWGESNADAFLTLDETGALAALRHWKYDAYVRLTTRNLLELDSVAETCAAISRVAEGVTRAALAYAFAEQVRKQGLPVRADGRLATLGVVGMGKLGGGELNYSSDIDLILIHDGDEAECGSLPGGYDARSFAAAADPTADDTDTWSQWQSLAAQSSPPGEHAISNGEFFQRVGRQMLRLLSVKTEEGLCFRADADLRPQGRSGLLVPSLGFTLGYYESQGREWERTALLKARRVAGAPQVWTAFAEAIQPFVYRRYLDFSAMEGIALIKHDIDRQQIARHQGDAGAENLKLGRGGIRESEFVVQAQQLLHGGRNPALQVPGHVAAVQALVETRLIEQSEAESLLADYWVLRNAENRVQMLEEAQVHTLPADPALRRRVLTDFRPGFAGRQAGVEKTIAQARARTDERFRRVFARLIPSTVAESSDWRATLAKQLPPPEAEPALAHVDGLLNRLMRTKPGERCVFKAERLLTRPELYQRGTEPAFPRWLALMEQIGNRNALYALLEAHPESLAWASRIFIEGGRHAPPLIRHPEFFESFLAPLSTGASSIDAPLDSIAGTSNGLLRDPFRKTLDTARDEEEFLLDVQTANAHARLHILSRYLEADAGEDRRPVMVHRRLLADLADTVVDTCARWAWRGLVQRYGLPEGAAEGPTGELSGFSVLALGKLGSREMRFGSDLDLVFLFRREGTTTKGRSHLELYTKLAQKLTALLTAPTQFGMLLELDHRLRPFGRKGLLVPSLAGYKSFLAQEAEVWNFQAFTRARHLCGDAELSAALLEHVAGAWRTRKAPPKDVAREVLDMARRLVAQAPPSAADSLQLKYALGGMLGFEFLRQCHFLLARQTGSIGENPGGWTPPEDRASIAGLVPDYETLSALDERASFYVEPFKHEVTGETFRSFAAVGRRWDYEGVRELCRRMEGEIAAEFGRLTG